MKTFAAGILALCLAVPALAQTGPATGADTAQPDTAPAARLVNGTRFGQWTLTCEAVAVGETACVLNQRIARTSDGKFLADFLMFWNPATDNEVFLAARVPIGAYLPAGFAIRSEQAAEDTQRPLTWQTCAAGVCEALTALTADDIAALEAGGDVIAGYRPSLRTDPVIFRFSMQGAKAGLDALGNVRE